MVDYILIIFAFFSVFMYQIIGSLMISNIVYHAVLTKDIIRRKSLSISDNRSAIIWLILFLSWVTISGIVFAIEHNAVSLRNLIQYFFTLQYVIFIINLRVGWNKFEKWVFRFSVILSIAIIFLFIITGEFNNISTLFGSGRMWAKDYIPGWPNSTPIPLLFGLFLSFKLKKNIFLKFVFISALVLTTSRGALLGLVLILLYFSYKKLGKERKKIALIVIPIILLLGFIVYAEIQVFFYDFSPNLVSRIGVTHDRQDIFNISITYILYRPLFGYGGHSLDQIALIYGNVSVYGVDWGHTHNWFLETVIRYGMFGGIFFIGFLIAIVSKIKNGDNKFMFLLIVLLGLFQAFFRHFNVLIFLLYLVNIQDDASIEQ